MILFISMTEGFLVSTHNMLSWSNKKTHDLDTLPYLDL